MTAAAHTAAFLVARRHIDLGMTRSMICTSACSPTSLRRARGRRPTNLR